MTNSWTVISAKPGTSGTATITSGTLSNSSTLYVGYGSGALNINGGLVSNATASLGWNFDNNNIGTGSATVTDGTWNNTTLIVGETGQGFLNISGGIVNSITGYIGRSGSSIGIATVTGGTWDNSSALYVGDVTQLFRAGRYVSLGGKTRRK